MGMNDAQLNSVDIVNKYKGDIAKLSKYLNWLEAKKSDKVLSIYKENDLDKTTLSVPVFDSNLLRFVKEAKQTQLIDENYVYVYSKFRIRDYKDEWKIIEGCKIQDMYILKGILSKYVINGMTKSIVWSEAVEYSIFLKVISKLKELMEFWDGEQQNGR